MAQGTAVVCSDLPPLREVADDAARFVEPTDVEAWCHAIVALLGDDDARSALADAGLARTSTFTWERSVAQHLAVYQSVLAS